VAILLGATVVHEIPAVLLVDPYNDFLSEGGKSWPRAKPIADEVGLLDNLRAIMRAAREAGLGIFFVSHRSWEPVGRRRLFRLATLNAVQHSDL